MALHKLLADTPHDPRTPTRTHRSKLSTSGRPLRRMSAENYLHHRITSVNIQSKVNRINEEAETLLAEIFNFKKGLGQGYGFEEYTRDVKTLKRNTVVYKVRTGTSYERFYFPALLYYQSRHDEATKIESQLVTLYKKMGKLQEFVREKLDIDTALKRRLRESSSYFFEGHKFAVPEALNDFPLGDYIQEIQAMQNLNSYHYKVYLTLQAFKVLDISGAHTQGVLKHL